MHHQAISVLAFAIIFALQVQGENSTSIVQDCVKCTSDGESAFFKHVYYAASQPRYSCMRNPPTSNLSWIVGRWCNQDECSELVIGEPAKRIYQPDELHCGNRLQMDIDKIPPLYIKSNSTLHFNTYNNNNYAIIFSLALLFMILTSLFYAATVSRMDIQITQIREIVRRNKNYAHRKAEKGCDTVC